MDKEKLDEIVASHGRWLRDEGGKRANLERANLRGAYLCKANLEMANLRWADLRGADLRGACLEGAELPIGVYQIVGPGRYNRCTTYDVINDQVICGCWDDGAGNHLNSFVRRIESIYGQNGKEPNYVYYAEYMSAINFFRAMKELK